MARTLLMLGAGQGLTVREFTVHEALSSLFDISIEAVSPDPDLDFDAIVGGPASFSIFGGIESMLDVAAQGAALGEAGQLAGFDGGTTPLAGIADAIAGAVSWVAQSASQTASRFTGNLVRDAIGGPVGEALANLAADQAGQLAQSLAQRLLADVEPVLQEVSRILREADRILGQVGAVLGALGAPLPGLSGLLGSGSDQSALALGRIPTPAGDLSLRAWHGVVKNISQVRAEASGLSTYRITLAPALWLLTQRRQNRLFQRMSVVEIARKLLGEWDITPLLRLDEESYPKLELRSQYNETDYHFLARLLEDAGITWMFRQSPVGLTELLLTDRPGVTDLPRAPIPYVDAPSASSDAPHVTDVRISDEVRPGRYAVRSTNPRVPTTVDLTGRAHLDQPVPGSVEPLLALDGYSPGRLDVIASAPDAANTPTADDRGAVRALPQVGSDVAARRLQAARAQKVQVSLRSNVLDVSAGSVVPIRSHPRTDLGGYQARELLVIASTISGDWSFAQNLLSAVPAEVPWSPPRTTDRPRVRGVQTARVVGPTAEQIHTDELGRVRVQFLWDREGQRDENSSPWIRVGQPAAGTGFGINTLPRAGQEVLVEFLEGNPDTPVLVGSVYNRLAVHPHKLPESRAKTTWKTESYPTRDNFNEISLDDTPGKEVVFLHAANVMEKEVQGDEREDTGENRRIIVGGDFIVQADGHIFLQSGQNRNVDIRAGANLRFNCTGPNSTPTPAQPPPEQPPAQPPAQPPGQPPASPGTQGPPTIEQVARGEGELRRGDRGPAVLELQRKLNRAGYPVVEDGVFGQETENAVKQFQRDNYLADSGRVGKTTWERLLAAPPVETGSAAPGTQAFPVNVPYQGPAGGQLFGASRDGGSRRHAGLDLTPPINIQGQSSSFPIFAWKAGVVDQSTGRANFGIVRIRHDDGMMSRYLHNTDTVVSTNTRVNAGQRIALMGGRGGSSNSDYVPHLHIEIYNSSGTAIDPKPILLDGSNNPRGGLIVYSHSQYGRPRSTYQA